MENELAARDQIFNSKSTDYFTVHAYHVIGNIFQTVMKNV